MRTGVLEKGVDFGYVIDSIEQRSYTEGERMRKNARLRGLALVFPLLAAAACGTADNMVPEVTANNAEKILTRYAEGRLLNRAPDDERIAFLRQVMNAAPEGSDTRKRAELLIESIETAQGG
jgi:hypothetical protein